MSKGFLLQENIFGKKLKMSHNTPTCFFVLVLTLVALSAAMENSLMKPKKFELGTNASTFGQQELLDKSGRAISLPDAISYLLYDKRNDTWVRMPNDGSVPKDLWNFRSPIKFLLHGFNGRPEREPMKVMQSMMIVGREYGKTNATLNIIAVNWTPLATRLIVQYAEAARNTLAAGIAVANYMMALKENKAFRRWSRIHMIGFSLGAHVSGIAGQEIQRLTGGRKIGRITGLDPAGPEFDKNGSEMPSDTSGILDKSDAHYVDIIHCNMGAPLGNNVIFAVLAGQFGSMMQAGHADFYPNGGERQRFQCDEIQDRGGCSHNMCSLFYALSITRELPGCPCRSWNFFTAGLCACWTGDGDAEYMGDLSNRRGTARGKYFLVVDQKLDVNYFLH